MSSIDIASSIWATLGSLVGMTTGRSQPWPAPRAVRVIGSILDCRYMDCDRDSDRDSIVHAHAGIVALALKVFAR